MLQSAPPHLRHFIVHLENTMWCTSTLKDRRSLHGCRRCLETARNQDKLKNALNIPGPLCIILGLLEVKLILSNGYINMREGTYAFVPLFWLNALLSIFIGISLSKKAERIIRGTHVANWLTSIGRDSIVYLCCNQLVIKVVTVVFEHFAVPSVVENILVLTASMMFLYILSVLFTKTRLKILVGK